MKGEICLFPDAFKSALREAMKEQLRAPLSKFFVKQLVKQPESMCKRELFTQQHLTLSGCGKRSG